MSEQGKDSAETLLALRESQLQNSITFILRLSRRLPESNEIRKSALEYLMRENLIPSPTRDTPAHLRLGSDESGGIPDPEATMREVREFLRSRCVACSCGNFGDCPGCRARTLLAKLEGK